MITVIKGSLKSSNERSNSRAGKIAAEKLWDGSLQLNSSVTVSAVAFFKSGEKMPYVKWSEFVEVKGKVKLEAFEKYIQDLPRSRNRGLMVISLCWKEGSSESGLAGMQKVAKGYKQGERVGFAQLSPGVDLYICPRSDTIITILAKHGFFKGMAAIEDNQDSLIGCVVWRRIRASSDSAAKKFDKKDHSLTKRCLNSPSDSSNRRIAEKDLARTKPARGSIPVALTKDCSTLESAGSNRIEGKNIKTSEVQLELHNSSTSANLSQTPSVLGNSTSISAGPKTSSHSDSASLQGSMGQSSKAPLTHNSGTEKPEPSLELQRPAFSVPSVVIKDPVSTPNDDDDDDDDDLPEFDFETERGKFLAPRSKPSDAAIVDKKLPAEDYKDVDVSLRSTIPTAQPKPAFSKRKLENFNLPSLSLDAIPKLPPLKKVNERDHVPALASLEEHTAQSRAIMRPISATAVPPPKNLFDDDDDDIPEWCPPDKVLHKQSVPQSASTTSISYKAPNSNFESLYPGHPFPLLRSLSQAAHPPFSTQVFPRVDHCPLTFINTSQPRPLNGFIQWAPSSLMGFNTNPLMRPPPNPFDFKFPPNPSGWRAWRP